MFSSEVFSPIQSIDTDLFSLKVNELSVLREDTIDDFVSGNKFRKLKYNIDKARSLGKDCLLTFGGAYSNHIAAVAAAGSKEGIKTIGVIRGEELEAASRNSTLAYAEHCGMQLHFVSREAYKQKESAQFITELANKFGSFYVLPEGGTNTLAVKGCEEILSERTAIYDYICVATGTGGTLAGLVRASHDHQKVVGFSALKGTFQEMEVKSTHLKPILKF